MKQLVLTYDTEGNLINSEEIDVPDPEPTEVEVLQAEIASLKTRLAEVENRVQIIR